LDFKKQTLLVLIFLSTCFFNKIIALSNDALQNKKTENNSFFEEEIKQYADDSIKISIDGKKAYLFGNARIEYQKTKISASYIEIDWMENILTASYTLDSNNNKIGKPIFSEGNDEFIAEEIKYNFKTKKSYIKNIVTKEGEGYILGKNVKKIDEVFYLQKGDYTTCNHEKPHFSIKANKIKVIAGEKIITGPAYLSFFGVPTPLFLPVGYFPNHNNKQSSGIIMPAYGESANMGFFIKDGGYYFAINNKIDLSLKSDIYSRGSWNIKSNMRYKSRYKYNGNFNISYGFLKNSYKGFPDYSEKQDFNIKWSHKQDPKASPSLNFSANIDAGTSTYHRNNSYSDDYLKNTMTSNISLSKSFDNLFLNNMYISLRHTQNTSNNIVSLTIPEISINSQRIYPFKFLNKSINEKWYEKISIRYNMNSRNTITTADSLLFTQNSISKFRNGIKHNIPITASLKILKHFNFNPSLNITERWYLNRIEKRWDDINNTLLTDTINKFTRGLDYNLSAGLNTKIYGLFNFKNKKIAALRHVITPSISFRYTPDFSSEKYNYYQNVQINSQGESEQYSIMGNGIYGSPTNRKTGNINFSLGNILDMKVKSDSDSTSEFKKIKLIESLNLSTSYNVFADSMNLSNIRLNARTRLLNILDITFTSDYDPYIVNKEKTGRLNQLEINTNKRIARLKSFSTSIGLRIDNSFLDTKNKDTNEEKEFFEIPWSLNANYSLNYNKGNNSSAFSDTTQSLIFSGNMKITNKWKVGFRSGYDFESKELTYSSIDVYRDLHCWELLFNWIPIGYHQSYTLTIRVKADVLKDLKYEKKKDWFVPDYN